MTQKKKQPKRERNAESPLVIDDLFDRCVRKGLIEKTEYGYYFTPEFFNTLDIYDDEDDA